MVWMKSNKGKSSDFEKYFVKLKILKKYESKYTQQTICYDKNEHHLSTYINI